MGYLCCLDCDEGKEGCWCKECACNLDDCPEHYERCDCDSGRGYCNLVNIECTVCRNREDYENY